MKKNSYNLFTSSKFPAYFKSVGAANSWLNECGFPRDAEIETNLVFFLKKKRGLWNIKTKQFP